MSANEIIEELQKLPVSDQERVLAFLENVRHQGKSGQGAVRYATDADFNKSAEKVLRDHADVFRKLAQ